MIFVWGVGFFGFFFLFVFLVFFFVWGGVFFFFFFFFFFFLRWVERRMGYWVSVLVEKG